MSKQRQQQSRQNQRNRPKNKPGNMNNNAINTMMMVKLLEKNKSDDSLKNMLILSSLGGGNNTNNLLPMVAMMSSNKSDGIATQDIVETGKKRDLAITNMATSMDNLTKHVNNNVLHIAELNKKMDKLTFMHMHGIMLCHILVSLYHYYH